MARCESYTQTIQNQDNIRIYLKAVSDSEQEEVRDVVNYLLKPEFKSCVDSFCLHGWKKIDNPQRVSLALPPHCEAEVKIQLKDRAHIKLKYTVVSADLAKQKEWAQKVQKCFAAMESELHPKLLEAIEEVVNKEKCVKDFILKKRIAALSQQRH